MVMITLRGLHGILQPPGPFRPGALHGRRGIQQLEPPPPAAVPSAPSTLTGRIIATPYAKKLAKKHKIDLSTDDLSVVN